MPVTADSCRAQLEAGFGSPQLAAILRPVAMDPVRLQRFVELWNRTDVQSIGDIITTQYVTRTVDNPVLPLPIGQPIVLTFDDSEELEIVRYSASAFDVAGAPIALERMFADVSIGSRSHMTSTPAPLSQIAGDGTNGWLLPVPVRLSKQQIMRWSITVEPALVQITSLTVTLHCVRLTF